MRSLPWSSTRRIRRSRPFLWALLLVAASAGRSLAAPVSCVGLTSLAELLSAGECAVQDKLYTFAEGSYSGGGGIPASQVTATVTFHPSDSGLLHGWSFKPVGLWSSDFSIAYTISVLPGEPALGIGRSLLQGLYGFSGTPQVVMTQNGGGLPTLSSTPGDETDEAGFDPATSIAVVNTGTVDGGAIVSVENLFLQTLIPIPEPSSLQLVGMGGLGLALIRRRRRGWRAQGAPAGRTSTGSALILGIPE
jgi:hypothetical protein